MANETPNQNENRSQKRRPEYNIVVFDEGGYSTVVGAAWTTKGGGGVTAELIPGVALTGRFAVLKKRPKPRPDEPPPEAYEQDAG